MERDIVGIKLTESPQRKLGYAQEFRQMVAEHPGILKTALELANRAENEYNPPNVQVGAAEIQWNKDEVRYEVIRYGDQVRKPPYEQSYSDFIWGRGIILVPGETLRDEETGLEVTTLGRSQRVFRGLFDYWKGIQRIDRSAYLKFELDDQAFFVKKSTATNNSGFNEFSNTHRAAGLLRGVEDLRIVEAQLGYEDVHQSWFISKWENLESEGFFFVDSWRASTPNDYGQFRRGEPGQEGLRQWWAEKAEVSKLAESKMAQIKTKLSEAGLEIYDLWFNLFFNPKTGKYFLLDISAGDLKKGIGQADPDMYDDMYDDTEQIQY